MIRHAFSLALNYHFPSQICYFCRMQIAQPCFFIVGNSRSGTTMMLRILNNHPHVFVLNELHFFEQLWAPGDQNKELSREQAIDLAARLYFVQKEGYTGEMDAGKYRFDAAVLIEKMGRATYLPHKVYAALMQQTAEDEGKSIPCEKTPQNVFYIAEILELFPNARIINMVRDPRAILLSQKRKWLRRKMGASFITKKEARRLRINYHPYTLSKLWNAAIVAAQAFQDHEQVVSVRFEDILEHPAETMQKICRHLGIPYHPEMLDIPQASSSNEADSQETGIKKERAGNWKNGGLSPEEIKICELTSGHYFESYGYEKMNPSANPILLVGWYLLFPLKLALALLLNLNRMKSIGETLKRRLRG
jgi:omega-hydroxy-beta-dihydromenaquinone-9 sulfotransferase